MKDLLHVVVGAGVPEYFSNCLNSIARHSDHDVLAFYNWVDVDDFRYASEIVQQKSSATVKILLQPNTIRHRTGSLYQAYNSAIERALGKYRFVSFIQADMQLMWWNDQIVAACDQFLGNQEGEKLRKICFYSQIPVQGKREDYYASWRDAEGGFSITQRGAVDVGIYPLNTVFSDGFRFSGTEKDFSARAAQHGVRVSLHPYPFLAPIPFPLTVRERKRRHRVKPEKVGPELVLSPLGAELIDFRRETFHPFFMEDYVWPNGSRVLTPYWPSDTLSPHWLRIRFRQSRLQGFSLLATQSAKRNHWLPLGKFRPGFLRLLSSGFRLLLKETRIRFGASKR